MLFAVVYFVYFSMELARKETLLDRVTEGYHYESFLERVRRRRPQSLAAIQLANLREINETFGVARADKMLKSLTLLLGEELLGRWDREGCIGRKTGAELLLALKVDPPVLQKALEEFTHAHEQIDGIDVEYHYAVIHNNEQDPEQTLDRLRDLLVRREVEKNDSYPVNVTADARRIGDEERLILESLKRGDLHLHFRPLLNLRTGVAEIYEVGVRMQTLEGAKILPKAFLPVINRNNLGESYDLLIVEKLLEISSLVDPKIAFSFNLSPFSLRKEAFLDQMLQRIEKSGVQPHRCIVELYERRKYHRMEEYARFLKRLRSRGVRICLDNFGAQNASMEYVRELSFDMIQFDREYTRELDNGKTLPILKSFVSMAHEMGSLCVAKWVDNSRKTRLLKEIGVDYIQGYAAGKVLDEEELIRAYNPLEKGDG